MIIRARTGKEKSPVSNFYFRLINDSSFSVAKIQTFVY